MPRHVAAVLLAFLLLVLATSTLISWLSVHWRLPMVENLLLSLQQRESEKTQEYIANNLQMMATRLGQLQAHVIQLDGLGERVSTLAGVKREPLAASGRSAQGGPYVPAPMTAGELQREIERLASLVENRGSEFDMLESRLLEKRIKDRLLPTSLPVRSAELGSAFGVRNDPIAGLRAMHEGIDFNAEIGTPVLAAADGVVLSAVYHPEFGNVIDIDHGEGLLSRYAHLSRMDVKSGKLLKRGELIGAVGNTGRSTGPHLHFEVRQQGVAQNPALFLKKSQEFAQLKRR
ncbi:MAG: M23 family peptidase [Rhodocyclales bacterium GT-UBC]|nr:MAG: M23 family peptidase [Rhodocyclales bacterium GT-UBC]